MSGRSTAMKNSFPRQTESKPFRKGFIAYVVAVLLVGVMTILIKLTHADASLVNIPPLYLLSVQAVALLAGSRPAILASFLAFIAFDWYFVEPKHQLSVRDPFEFVALCVFLVTAIVVGQLTSRTQRRAQESHERELAATALAEASWTVASELNVQLALNKVIAQLEYVTSIESAAIVLFEGEKIEVAATFGDFDQSGMSMEAVQFVSKKLERIGWEDSQHWNKALKIQLDKQPIYLPIAVDHDVLGVFFLLLKSGRSLPSQERQVVLSLINHIAIVLQRDKLIQAQAMTQALAEANRLKTALLQMVSHDFRSPLASIKASVSSVLVDEGAPIDAETLHGLLQAIDQETDRLNRMVGNILDLSRLEADAWKPQKEMFSLAELIGASLDSFSRDENSRIGVNLPADVNEVFVDSVQIVQVLKNLIENALKYSVQAVEINVSQEEQSVLIEVADRGQGLPVGAEERIFEPFYRAPEHQESAMPGVGIGLAICRGLVEAHGGKLTAKNRAGGGSRFLVTLPRSSNDS